MLKVLLSNFFRFLLFYSHRQRKNVKINYSCYDLKQPSKVNLSVYFLPAVGWEKVIKIRRFSNETAIKILKLSIKVIKIGIKIRIKYFRLKIYFIF
ncbi:MAG: hypothetical protein LBR79_02125 [Oscillospiraceae bacterium]|nr:hypothetical protein [Oscillospiraceae bacterium]